MVEILQKPNHFQSGPRDTHANTCSDGVKKINFRRAVLHNNLKYLIIKQTHKQKNFKIAFGGSYQLSYESNSNLLPTTYNLLQSGGLGTPLDRIQCIGKSKDSSIRTNISRKFKHRMKSSNHETYGCIQSISKLLKYKPIEVCTKVLSVMI